ncbi:hypothetical protein ACFZ8E_19085 [Methylobacterium sp. HMF5984]|uniref:hypothetical protein n=1 Tax=Methylobacterium sp. HMF5984 TaxID=3367370 RepID=UPI003851C508
MSGSLTIADAFSSLRRSVVDPVTGRAVVTSAPTGDVIQRSSVLPVGRDDAGRLTPAVPGMIADAFSAAQMPGQVFRGEQRVMDPTTGHVDESAIGRAFDLAGTAMTGSMPFSAPRGALRMFGGAATHEADPFAALEAGLAAGMKEAEPIARPMTRVDPAAKSWDLYHGTAAPEDFTRFDPHLAKGSRPHTPDGETGAVFLSPAPGEANHYASPRASSGLDAAGPRVIRTTVDPGKTAVLDLPALFENDPAFVARAREAFIQDARTNGADPDVVARAGSVFDERHARMLDEFQGTRDLNEQLAELGYHATEVPQVQWGYGATSAAVQHAREQGLDTAILRGLSESNGGDQVVALTPGRVRSHYAPDQLLYNGGPGGALAGAMALGAGDGRERRAPRSIGDEFGGVR